MRASSNIPPSKALETTLVITDEAIRNALIAQKATLESLAKCTPLTILDTDTKPPQTISAVVRGINIYLHIGQAIDVDQEKAKLEKEIKRLQGNIMVCNKKLSNDRFMANAKQAIIDSEKEKLASMEQSLIQVKDNLDNLSK